MCGCLVNFDVVKFTTMININWHIKPRTIKQLKRASNGC